MAQPPHDDEAWQVPPYPGVSPQPSPRPPRTMQGSSKRQSQDLASLAHAIATGARYDPGAAAGPSPSRERPRHSHRYRVESVSSVGSSVAPAALPGIVPPSYAQQQQRQHKSTSRSPAQRPSQPPLAEPYAYWAAERQKQELEDEQGQPVPSLAASGLAGWLKSQAAAGRGPEQVGIPSSSSPFASFAPSGRIRRNAGSDTGSDTNRSLGGKSNSARRRREGSTSRPGIPEWSDGALLGGLMSSVAENTAEADGVGGETDMLDEVISQSSTRRRRRRGYESGMSARGGTTRREMSATLSQGTGGTDTRREGSRRRETLPPPPGNAAAAWSGGDDDASTAPPGLSSSRMVPSRSLAESIGAASSSVGARTTAHFAGVSGSGRSSRMLLAAREARNRARRAKDSTPLRRWVRWLAEEQGSHQTSEGGIRTFAAVGLLATIFFKWTAGLGAWSGRANPPMYGDFEAQRHWMEITLHLPPSQWYTYDLQYWGLDYPPLTAYVSWLCAKIGAALPGLASSFALDLSRGDESLDLVTYMRFTVLALDLLVYTPAVLYFLSQRMHGRGRRTRAVAALGILLQPALILIDHGHFQYNSVMLGLSAAAFALLYTSLPNPDATADEVAGPRRAAGGTTTSAAISGEWQRKTLTLSRRVSYSYVAAAFLFSLSLCFKQMALYFAPAVFAVMLGRCIGLASIGFERGLSCFGGLAFVTTLTFAVNFAPWLTSLSSLGQVLHRIFPLSRGLFEDKVANVWCFVSVLPLPAHLKLRNVMGVEELARLSLLTTLAAIALPCLHQGAAAVQTVRIENLLAEDASSGSGIGGGALPSARRRENQASASSTQIGASRQPTVGATSAVAAPASGIGTNGLGGVGGGGSGLRHRGGGAFARPLSIAAGSDAGTDLASLLSAAAPPSHLGIPGGGGGGGPGSVISTGDRRFGLSSMAAAGGSAAVATKTPSPSASVLPYALLSTSLAFFLFGFQTHEKSVLLPLLPLTLVMTVRGDEWGGGAAKAEWEWAVLGNNVAVFSMWPLLKRDGLTLQYVVLTLVWNWLVGSRPFAELQKGGERRNFVGLLSAAVHAGILALHALELATPLVLPAQLRLRVFSRYPDLFAVANVLACAPVLVLLWLWSMRRQLEVGLACGVGAMGVLGERRATAAAGVGGGAGVRAGSESGPAAKGASTATRTTTGKVDTNVVTTGGSSQRERDDEEAGSRLPEGVVPSTFVTEAEVREA